MLISKSAYFGVISFSRDQCDRDYINNFWFLNVNHIIFNF